MEQNNGTNNQPENRQGNNQQRMNTMALVGFIMGIVGVAYNPIMVPSILGIVFSAIGMKNFNRELENNRWMAITGLVLGIVGTAYTGFILLAAGAIVGGMMYSL